VSACRRGAWGETCRRIGVGRGGKRVGVSAWGVSAYLSARAFLQDQVKSNGVLRRKCIADPANVVAVRVLGPFTPTRPTPTRRHVPPSPLTLLHVKARYVDLFALIRRDPVDPGCLPVFGV
jgi:hypothetical protein